jgi:hypothetical protein
LLKLLLEDCFPQIRIPRTENRDPRQLLLAGQRSMKKLFGWEARRAG